MARKWTDARAQILTKIIYFIVKFEPWIGSKMKEE